MDREMKAEERYGFDYDIHEWYEKCKDFTFQTEFLQITPAEAKVICKQYEKTVLKQKKEFTDEDYNIYKQLEEKIDEMLNTHFYDDEEDCAEAFVRLSARSPKDAAINSEKMKQILKRKLYCVSKDVKSAPKLYQNYEFISFFEAQREVMRFESAQQVMEMHCSSQRVYDDLNIALTYKLPNNDKKNDNKFELSSSSPLTWDVQMVFRRWSKQHDIGLEFRGFVYERKLTAISQYFEPLYYPKLDEHKESYIFAIQKFFDSVKETLPFESCIMDFLITEPTFDNDDEDVDGNDDDDDNEDEEGEEEKNSDQKGESENEEGENKNGKDRDEDNRSEEEKKNINFVSTSKMGEDEFRDLLTVQVIEFNPFNAYTSAALFSWDKDLELFKGNRAFEFRYIGEPLVVRNELPRNDDEAGNLEKQVRLMNVDPSILEEYSELLQMVDDLANDDVERIHVNLRSTLAELHEIAKIKTYSLS